MSGLHLVKQGRDRRRIDLQRDFTVASPAEFVTRFGGNKVIEKVKISISHMYKHFLFFMKTDWSRILKQILFGSHGHLNV